MDVTPIIPAGRQVIDSYGPAGFRISGILHPGSVLVTAEQCWDWPVTSFADLRLDDFAPIIECGDIAILLLGCGKSMQLVPRVLREGLRAAGIVLDAMDTGAACRTYDVLLSEERRVAAALIRIS